METNEITFSEISRTENNLSWYNSKFKESSVLWWLAYTLMKCIKPEKPGLTTFRG